jgi:tetratricopeptide (TPR) repeat protein
MKKTAATEPFDEARAWFQKALDFDPWYANVGSRMGALLLFQGNFVDSIQVNRRTVQTLDAYEIHERMGAAYFLSGNVAAAGREWNIVRLRYAPAKPLFDALVSQISTK